MNRAAQPAKCSKCGYNMQGLESSKCPECGTINAPKDYRAILQEQSKDLARKTWLTPILVTLGCLLASSVCWGISPAGLPGVLVMLVSWGIMVPVGLLAFWLCTLIFLEFDAPWGVTILRLAQIFAIMTLPGALLATLGYYTVATRGLVGLALMVILCITILEVEMTDAIWLSIVINILQAVIIMVMVQAFASM